MKRPLTTRALLLLAPLAALVGAALPATAPAPAAQDTPAGGRSAAGSLQESAPGIAIAARLAGTWRETRAGRAGDSLVEEIWSAPSGNNVVGAFRWLGPEGTAYLYELLTISAEPDGIFLRLRHFDPRLVAKEARDEPQTLRLERSTPELLRFAAHAHCDELESVTYDRSEEDVLAIEVVFTAADGRPPLRFRLLRA